MKKIFTTTLLCAAVAGAMAQAPAELPEKLYMMEEEGLGNNATFKVTEEDPYLTLKEGVYEGTVTVTKDVCFRFYVGTAEEYTVLGPDLANLTGWSQQVSFSTYATYEGDCNWYDATQSKSDKGSWQPSMEQGVTELEVVMVVDPTELTVSFEPIQPKEPAPEAMYIWGSTDGGEVFSNFGKMEPSEDNPYLFTITFEVPECGPFNANSQAPGVFDKNEGFYFKVSDASTGGGNMYGFPIVEDAEGNSNEDGKYIELEVDGTPYTASLGRTGASNLVDLTPGVTVMTFNAETWEFTAELIEEYVGYYIWGSTDGGYKYTCMGEMEENEEGLYVLALDVPECGPFEEDPDAAFGGSENFTSGFFFFVSNNKESVSEGVHYYAPVEVRTIEFDEAVLDYKVTLDVAGSPDLAPMVDFTPGNTIFTFDPETLEFVAEFNDELTKVESLTTVEGNGVVYNLQGVKVADNAASLKGLKGIYIVNGKKVVVK